MVILSLGAGVQSTTLLLMACHGKIKKPNVAVFADTQWEPKEVYDHLNKLKTYSEKHGISVDIVTKGNLRKDALTTIISKNGKLYPKVVIPTFLQSADGDIKPAFMRACTSDYKIEIINSHLRKKYGVKKGQKHEKWLGISMDEIQRMKPSRVPEFEHVWPLIDLGMTRQDCISYMATVGWTAPKSSCIGCPFHSDAVWLRMKNEQPTEFQDAIDFDLKIRFMYQGAPQFLHRSGKPLAEVEFSHQKQPDLFDMECEGMCGV
jgi:hypothetical protein